MTCRHGAVGMVAAVLLAVGCAPRSFVAGDPGRQTVELRDGLGVAEAWEQVVDAVTEHWAVEYVTREGRYLRTAWQHHMGDVDDPRYRRRLRVKFGPEEKRCVEVFTEAQWWTGEYWEPGRDRLFQQRAYRAICGRVGRDPPPG